MNVVLRLCILAASCPHAVDAAVVAGVLRGRGAALALSDLRTDVVGADGAKAAHAANATGVVALASARKPVRINRGDAVVPDRASQKPQAEGMVLRCNLTMKVHSGSDKNDICPDECPFFAQDRKDADFGTFSCVKESDCRRLHPETPIGDRELGVCRSCIVDGCETCDHSVTEDRCARCQAGFILKDGLCHFKYAGPWIKWVGVFLLVLVILVLLWIVDMVIRPCSNEDGLNHGLQTRERKKLRMKKNQDGERNLWPLSTNLMSTLGGSASRRAWYADLLLNTILGILIFYFPGGYTWMLFLGMAGSHVWIYAFDHYRVLRSIPSCTFASYDVEWWAQAMMAPIIGVIASCWAFKANCEPGFHCLRGAPLILLCCFVWALHVVVHLAVLNFVVPKFSKPPPEEDPAAVETFQTLSARMPCSWLTSNPVHCLRSKHFYSHSPPCMKYVLGKEYIMRPNTTIGCFFDESATSMLSPKARKK